MSRVDLHESNGAETKLVTRLDPAIGETSTGIGLLMSELVRRSLRAGVAEIDETIHTFATEQVEIAVDRKMVEVTEVAEATSRRVSESAVRKAAEKADQVSEQLTKSLSSAVDRFETELAEARRRSEETGLTLEGVRQKARHSWKKIIAEIEALKGADSALQRELAAAQERERVLQAGMARLETELSQSQQRLQVMLSQLDAVSERLAEIERPKGFSALLQRIRGKGKSSPSAPAAADGTAETESPGAPS